MPIGIPVWDDKSYMLDGLEVGRLWSVARDGKRVFQGRVWYSSNQDDCSPVLEFSQPGKEAAMAKVAAVYAKGRPNK